jgi:membrane protein DedA with SNARE-associated domain
MRFTELLFILKTPAFTHFVERFGYIGILLWFLTFDQLTPIPEEISLLIIGYLSAHQIFNPVIAGAFSLAGFLLVDTIYFYLSKKSSSFIKKKTKGSSSLMKSYRNKLKTNTPRAVMILCFIPRMRMFAPILAGSMKLSFKKFLLYDSIALALFTAIYLILGIIFNKSLENLITKTKSLQDIVFFAAVFIIAIIIIVLVHRMKKDRKE